MIISTMKVSDNVTFACTKDASYLTDGPNRDVGKLQICNRSFYDSHKDEGYPMNNEKRGTAHIFNIKTFPNTSHKARNSTDVDRDKVKKFFEEVHFNVIVHDNDDSLTAEGLLQHMIKIGSDKGLINDQCLVICVLSHGHEEAGPNGEKVSVIIGKDGQSIRIDKLLEPVTNSQCENLRGKPRIVLFQSCRGSVNACSLVPDGSDTFSDFFIGYSTEQGNISWRCPTEGSFYIHHVVRSFTTMSHNLDITSMMTTVRKEVVRDMMNETGGEILQYPVFEDNLKTKLYFYPGIFDREGDTSQSEDDQSGPSTSGTARPKQGILKKRSRDDDTSLQLVDDSIPSTSGTARPKQGIPQKRSREDKAILLSDDESKPSISGPAKPKQGQTTKMKKPTGPNRQISKKNERASVKSRTKYVKLKDLECKSRMNIRLKLTKEPQKTENSYQMCGSENIKSVKLFASEKLVIKKIDKTKNDYNAGSTYCFLGVLVVEQNKKYPVSKGFIKYNLRIDERTVIKKGNKVILEVAHK